MNNIKNIVVLKNLPSNFIDEAIVILKSNKMAKKLKYIEKKSSTSEDNLNTNSKEYIIKEAEMVICNYISNIEKQKNKKSINIKNIEEKYKKFKALTYTFLILFILSLIF